MPNCLQPLNRLHSRKASSQWRERVGGRVQIRVAASDHTDTISRLRVFTLHYFVKFIGNNTKGNTSDHIVDGGHHSDTDAHHVCER